MRTLLIAPSFLAVFVAVIFSVGWVISYYGQGSPNLGSLPSRAAYADWSSTMPAHASALIAPGSQLHERIEEVGRH